MKRIVCVMLWVVLAMAATVAVGADLPGSVTAADFGSPEANALWAILAGQGVWGAVLFGILGVVWKIGRPYLDEWVKKHRLATLFAVVEVGVEGIQATYVDAIKEASKDGKLTEEEAKIAIQKCRAYVIEFLKAQGIDVIREFGHGALDMAIEAAVAKLKLNNVLKAVALPLPDLGPQAPSV